MKKLINRVEDVLNEQLQGLAKAHPQLTLHQDPLYVTRTDAPVAGKVALLSGGGSGHEPMHCGYIGEGHALRRLSGRNLHLADAGQNV